jgi:hypothetical protein
MMRALALVVAFMLLHANVSFSQGTNAVLSGTVMDATQAMIPERKSQHRTRKPA